DTNLQHLCPRFPETSRVRTKNHLLKVRAVRLPSAGPRVGGLILVQPAGNLSVITVEQRTAKIFLSASRKPLKTVKDETRSNDGQRLCLFPFCASVGLYARCRSCQYGK